MKKVAIALLLLASACERGADSENRAADVQDRGAEGGAGVTGPGTGVGKRGATPSARLTGLWEGGQGPQKDQLCIIEKGRGAQFGLLVWGGDQQSCSGAGEAVRSGERLSLKMAGDETCSIEARLSAGKIVLPASVPEGCSYYCAAGAKMAGASFGRSGESEADALKAKDIAGDALCG